MARPSFKPTAALRRKVAVAAGGGMSHDAIALGMGISRGTLEKHFAKELSAGACEKRIEALDAMHTAAKKGNVAAQKAYIALSSAPSASAGRMEPKGKKELANDNAVTAADGTDWEDLLGGNVTPIRKPA